MEKRGYFINIFWLQKVTSFRLKDRYRNMNRNPKQLFKWNIKTEKSKLVNLDNKEKSKQEKVALSIKTRKYDK